MSGIAEILERQLVVDHSPKLKKWEKIGKSEAKSPVPDAGEQQRRIGVALERQIKEARGRKPTKREISALLGQYGRFARNHLQATNPYVQKVFSGHLFRSFQDLAGDKKAYAITIYCPDYDFDVDMRGVGSGGVSQLVDLMKQPNDEIRRVLKGFEFLAMFDLALLRKGRKMGKQRGSKGQEFAGLPHHHGIVFGDRGKIEAALQRRIPGLRRGRGGAKVYKITEITDLRVWLEYMAKDPRCTYRLINWGKDRKMRRERMHAPQQLYLFDLYGDVTKPEMCLGSGIGSEIVRMAVKAAGGSRRPTRD